MNTLCRSLLTLCVALFTTFASAETGEITKRISGCDYYIVDAPSGFAILEWYGGHDPDKDDRITGNFKRYGFHDFLVNDDEETRAYVEDWGLSREDALEELVDKCE
jgi:hypothetical protein